MEEDIDWVRGMFRNKEIRQFAIVFALIATITIILGFIVNIVSGILAITSSAAFGTAFCIYQRKI